MFKILHNSQKSRARLGIIKTPHGSIATPAFIPVGTKATVKGLSVEQLKTIGVSALLCNTYHLYLRPGDQIIKKHGGLHQFMGWDQPLFTDSGGFQVLSLGPGLMFGGGKFAKPTPYKKKRKKLVEISEAGVKFRSHIDGSECFISPESSIKIQQNLGADIIFAFDECTSTTHDKKYTEASMRRTHRWAERCLKSFKKNRQQLWGIVQGGEYEDLRQESARYIGNLNFSGFGIGGSLGNVKTTFKKVLDWTVPLLPPEKPKHLLGIGSLREIQLAVQKGIDTFDCVAPTRLARNGVALALHKNLNLRSRNLLNNKKPIAAACACYACQNFSRGYLCHLFRSGEMLGAVLATIHNLYFMEKFMEQLRLKIKNGNL